MARPAGLVAFDLDGTLLRGPTVCEVLARPVGRVHETREFEAAATRADVAAGRVAMARWYRDVPMSALLSALGSATWAPGVAPGIQLLRRNGIEVAIASITWRFAVRWFADRLDVRWHLGTDLLEDGGVAHVWPEDKGRWLRSLASELSVPWERVAAVGDSRGDVDLLEAASLRIFVGSLLPAGLADVQHLPDESIEVVAGRIVEAWHMDVTTLGFCTRCGTAVAPYQPSTVSLRDAYEYGTLPLGLESEPHYSCAACRTLWLATNLVDTGQGCPVCNVFMPLAAEFCGSCGAALRAEQGGGGRSSPT